jgi:hypothetical protein
VLSNVIQPVLGETGEYTAAFTFNPNTTSDMVLSDINITVGSPPVSGFFPQSVVAATVALDPDSRLFAFDADLAGAPIGPQFVRPCFDGVTRTPWNGFAIRVVNGVPNPAQPVALSMASDCVSLVPYQTSALRSCTGAETGPNAYNCAQLTVPGSLPGVYIGCESLPTPLRFRDTSSCRCLLTSNSPLSCFLHPLTSDYISDYGDYHAVSSIMGTPGQGFPAGPVSAGWAHIPYGGTRSAGPERRTMQVLQSSGNIGLWGHPVRSVRNYDIGECDLTRSWEQVSTMTRNTAYLNFINALRARRIPEQVNPTTPSECASHLPYSVVTQVRVGPQLNNSGGDPATRVIQDSLNFAFQYQYGLAGGAVVGLYNRPGYVYVNAQIGTLLTAGSTVAWRPFIPIGTGTVPSPLIEGDWQTHDANNELPIGWQMSAALRGAPLVSNYTGGCAPTGDAHPPFATLMQAALTQDLIFHWRLPFPQSNSPNAPSCTKGAAPRYVFCETTQPQTPAGLGTIGAPAANCMARLAAQLTAISPHPVFAALAAAGITAADLVPAGLEAGCYAFSTLPPWLQNDVMVTNQTDAFGTNAGICAFRFEPRRINVLPEGLQYILLDDVKQGVDGTTTSASGINLMVRLSEAFEMVYGTNRGLSCRRQPYFAPGGTPSVDGMIAHDSNRVPRIGSLDSFPSGTDVTPTAAIHCDSPSACSAVGTTAFPTPAAPLCSFAQ